MEPQRTRDALSLPPVISGAAEGLSQAVHGLAFCNCDSLVFEAVAVLPRSDEE